MGSRHDPGPRRRRNVLQWIALYFFRGLLFVVPAAASVYVVYFLFTRVDGWINVEPLLNRRVPGAGIVLTAALITIVGFLTSNFATRWLFHALEDLLARTPLVKLLYTSFKDLVGAFVGEKKRFERPVMVALGPDSQLSAVGFVTRDGLERSGVGGHVAVYLPQAYNIGGNVVVVPEKLVRPLDADPAAVMTFVVSGGIAGDVQGGTGPAPQP